jgi:hypothetical protein
MNKPWYLSKVLWTAVITLVIDVLALPQFLALVPLGWLPYTNLAGIILVMVLRTWYTDTNLTK